MRTIQKYLIILYLLICPVEIALHLMITSSVKYVGLLIVLVEGCILLYNIKGMDVNFSSCSMATFLWVAYCAVALLWTEINDSTYEYLTTYMLMMLLLIACTLETWNEKEILQYLNAYMIGGILMALAVIFFGGSKYADRETITIMGKSCDPNQVAANIIPGAVLSLNMFLTEKSDRKKNLFGLIGVVICAYSIFQTGSRGGFAALVVGAVLVIYVTLRKGKLKTWTIVFSILVGIVVVRYVPIFKEGRALDFDSYTATYSNGLNRIVIWKTLLKSFDGKWILGHGVGSTINYLEAAIGRRTAVHNTFLHVLYEVGIVGFLIFFFPYFWMMKTYIKKNGELTAILAGAVICSIFLDALNLRYLWNGLILCMMQYHLDGGREPEMPKKAVNLRSKYIKDY